MHQEVDARNLGCPHPVLLTKKALEGIPSGVLVVRVNSEAARDNVARYAQSQHCQVQVTPENGEYVIRIIKGQSGKGEGKEGGVEKKAEKVPAPAPGAAEGKVFLLTADSLGRGAEDLGATLMRNFIFTLLDSGFSPVALLFVNSGVKLCTEGSPVLEYLQTLQTRGTRVLSCGTCLNFYGLAEKLKAGEATTMVTIVEYLTGPYQVIAL